MIPNTKDRSVTSHGVGESGAFGISTKDSAHIMQILRDTLYSDKILAVLREYSSNGWDSHRAAGKPNVPIKVVLPTQMNPTLTIRDFGVGLSKEDVFQVYTQYGASTKRDNDDSVGMLGIGSKSGFAYSDSFTITSFHGGMKRTFVAVLDSSEKGVINLLHEEPCGDETGVEIQIAVRPNDINQFQIKAGKLFKYFDPRPDINFELPPKPSDSTRLVNGAIYDASGDDNDLSFDRGWVAIMGCVPYRIDTQQLVGVGEGVASFIHDLGGALYFNIGDVQVAANREELRYTEGTKEALVKKFNALIEEYVTHTLDNIEKTDLTPWEKLLRARVLGRLKLPVPPQWKDLTAGYVPLTGEDAPEHKSFSIHTGARRANLATSIHVDHLTRLVIRDDSRSLLGFHLRTYDYLVRRAGKTPWPDVEKELEEFCKKLNITGIAVIKTSAMEWCPPTKTASGKTINPKHKVKTFRLNLKGRYFSSPASKNWEVETRVPSTDDVFVILEKFYNRDLHGRYSDDHEVLKYLGGVFPTVYGYKSTSKDRVYEEKCVGTEYCKWMDKYILSLISQKVFDDLEDREWEQVLPSYWSGKGLKQAAIEKAFGKNHPITEFISRHFSATKKREKAEDDRVLDLLSSRLPKRENKAEAAKKHLLKTYPLLGLSEVNLTRALSEQLGVWAQYINAVDFYKPPISFEELNASASVHVDQ